jgi:hypothetical protein
MKNKFAIQTPAGFVAGWSREHFCVQTAGTPFYIKLFSTPKAAEKFIAKYDGMNGMPSGRSLVVEAAFPVTGGAL